MALGTEVRITAKDQTGEWIDFTVTLRGPRNVMEFFKTIDCMKNHTGWTDFGIATGDIGTVKGEYIG